ncbi:hypothetical protein QF042_003379 [Pedobacter sp. W3I1]|nr:hypothetical protein [Pedobacter sp. W3I1]
MSRFNAAYKNVRQGFPLTACPAAELIKRTD